ncbi:MAG: GMP synthase [Planctomycetota bacterium]
MPAFTQSTAKIAAWNLAGFGQGGIPQERLERQAQGLSYLDAEVVVLVEVNPPSAIETLEMELAKCGLEYDHVLLEQNSSLHIGVLFKRGITAQNAFLLEGSDLGDGAKRKALVVDIEVGRFDFKLIAVHLKSGRQKSNQQIRDEQCKVIGDFITAQRASSREDILLVGDFNMIPGQDISNFHHLGGDDLMDFLSSWDLQARFSHILEAGRANLLDGFAISRTFSTEYVRGSLRLFPMHWTMDMGRERFRERVSDHLPFVATFKIDRSRD